MAQWPDWLYQQSAALPYREQGDGPEVLLITSRGKRRWLAPKGIVEPGLTPYESAAKEAWEEAGVRGEIVARKLGRYLQRKWGGICEIEVFPMKVTEEFPEWPEGDFRRREWMSVSEAVGRIDIKALRKIVRRLPKMLEKHAEDGRCWLEIDQPSARLIYLFRHAKSSWDNPCVDDASRPLAPRGERAVERMRDYMAFADVRPDLVLCSAALRTRATLGAVRPAIGEVVPVSFDHTLYHAPPEVMLDRLCGLPDDLSSVMMVGHNPGLQALAVVLTGCGDGDALARMHDKFATGGLATLVFRGETWRDLEPGMCELHSFVLPRDIP